jgi:hypothetical protein
MVGRVFVFRNTVRKTKRGDSEVVACHKELVVGPYAKSESQFLGCAAGVADHLNFRYLQIAFCLSCSAVGEDERRRD